MMMMMMMMTIVAFGLQRVNEQRYTHMPGQSQRQLTSTFPSHC